MPNYIDKEKLIRDLIDNRNFYPAIVKRAIENAPTEDVVPRAEVEEAKQEVAREIFTELDNEYGENNGAYRIDDLTYGDIRDFLAELKKKYIGD